MIARIAITLLAIPLAILLIVCVVAGVVVAMFREEQDTWGRP